MKKRSAPTPDEAEEQPSQAWKFFVAFGIILVIFVGWVSYQKYDERRIIEENRYHGFDFAQAQGGLWVTRIEARGQPYNVPFYHHPRELVEFKFDPTVTDPIVKGAPSQIFISVDPDAGAKVVIAAVEISRLTGSRYNLYNIDTKSALSRPIEGKLDIPVMSCANATPDRVVIQFIQGPENILSREGSCVKLQYTTPDESVKVADMYAYLLLRIM